MAVGLIPRLDSLDDILQHNAYTPSKDRIDSALDMKDLQTMIRMHRPAGVPGLFCGHVVLPVYDLPITLSRIAGNERHGGLILPASQELFRALHEQCLVKIRVSKDIAMRVRSRVYELKQGVRYEQVFEVDVGP